MPQNNPEPEIEMSQTPNRVHSDKYVEDNAGYAPAEPFDGGYEYSQPYTITGTIWPRPGNSTDEGKVTSPFGVESEVAVVYYQSNDNNGICMVSYDMPIPTTVPSNTTAGNFLGNIFKNNVPSAVLGGYFVPVKDYVAIYANMPTGQFVLTLQFRRTRILYIPHEEVYYGDSSS